MMIYTNRYGAARRPESLARLSPPPPGAAGRYWRAVPHDELLDVLYEEVHKQSGRYVCGTPCVHLSRDEATMAASWTVDWPAAELPPGVRLSMGVTNSNAQAEAMKLYGGVVVDGTAGVPLAVYDLGRHTVRIDLEEKARAAVAEWAAGAKEFPRKIRRLMRQPVGAGAADVLLLKAGRAGIMPWSRLKAVDAGFRAGEHSAWSFLLAFAHAAARNPPLHQMGQVLAAYKMLGGS